MGTLNVFGQQTDLMNFVPVSPSAAALGKFGNIPVSYYNGLPTIEIPLYSIEQNGLNVPIKLSYHAGGVKVSELSSWIGIGWALQAGGSIIRNERGLSDDHNPLGFLRNGKSIDENNLTIGDYYKAAKGNLDLESDEYIFNFPGGSGKFVFDQQASPLLVPFQAIKIYPLDYRGSIFTSASSGDISGWRIVDMNGVQYFFEVMEVTKQIFQTTNNRHNTAWNLTRIISADKETTIEFEYESAGYAVSIPISQTTKYYAGLDPPCGSGEGAGSQPYDVMQSFGVQRLTKIKFNNGYIEFIPSASDRCDLLGDEFLDKIMIRDNNDAVIKEIDLAYGYMYGNTITPVEQFSCGTGVDKDAVRLTLLSVQETGKTPYKFDYIHDKGLPTRFSAAQDHWGFYNRNHSNLFTLIPSGFETSPTVRITGTSREANIAYGQQGTLNKITYPTGGNTVFEYEPHTALLSTLSNFPELSYGYTEITNPERTFQVDYGYNNYELGSFVIDYLESGTSVSFKAENFIESSGSYFVVVNASNEIMHCEFGHRDGSTSYYSCGNLPNGTYRIIAKREPAGSGNPTGQTYPLTLLEYKSVTYVQSQSHLITIGGLRIKRMIDTDPLTNTTQSREFEYMSGALTWGIKYSSKRKEYLCYTLEGSTLLSYTIGDFYVLSSNSNYPLSNTQGGPVGYGGVIMREYYIDQHDNSKKENGYTYYRYKTALSNPDEGFASKYMQGNASAVPPISGPSGLYGDNTSSSIVYQFPFSPPRNNDWQRGLLEETSVFRKNINGTYTKISGETNNYQIAELPRTSASVKCGIIFDSNIQMSEVSELHPINAPLDEVAFSFYNSKTQYTYLNFSTGFIQDDLGHRLETKTEYFYDNADHLLPNRVIKTSNHGEKEISVVSYPQDYLSGTSFIDDLVSSNNISAPIESATYREESDGTKRVKSGYIYTYKTGGTGLQDDVRVLENNDNLLVDNFKFSNRSIGVIPTPSSQKAPFVPDLLYKSRVKFNSYSHGKLLEQQKDKNISNSYIWGYNNQYPIAQVVNASSSNIAYTSFEDEAFGNWAISGGNINPDISLTGDKSYTFMTTSTISKNNLSQADYVVSYWSRSGSLLVNGSTVTATMIRNGWSYFVHRLSTISNVAITATSNTVIDELRLFPETAQMTTYTFRPLVGVSSITDSNNNTLYYKYDSAGRLELTQNSDGRIIEHFKYHYKGQ